MRPRFGLPPVSLALKSHPLFGLRLRSPRDCHDAFAAGAEPPMFVVKICGREEERPACARQPPEYLEAVADHGLEKMDTQLRGAGTAIRVT